jgi:hypothetical protein
VNDMLYQGFPFCSTPWSCAPFAAVGASSFFVPLSHAHKPSIDDQEGLDEVGGGGKFVSSCFPWSGADGGWGDGGGMAFEAVGATL